MSREAADSNGRRAPLIIRLFVADANHKSVCAAAAAAVRVPPPLKPNNTVIQTRVGRHLTKTTLQINTKHTFYCFPD